MKSLLLFALTILALSSISFSQDKCCENKESSCCTDNKTCEKADLGLLGNAGGDSVAAISCPVSNEAIPEGGGVKFDYYGKTYTFCCEGCMAKFKKEPLDYIKTELTCPVMGDPIESKNIFATHNGTKYYLCCKNCLKSFENDPEKYLNKQ